MTRTNLFKDHLQRVEAWIWDTDIRSAPIWERVILRTLRILVAVIRDLRDGQLSLRAMSLVYNTVIAIVPLLALSFSVLKGFGMHNEVEPALLEALVELGRRRAWRECSVTATPGGSNWRVRDVLAAEKSQVVPKTTAQS